MTKLTTVILAALITTGCATTQANQVQEPKEVSANRGGMCAQVIYMRAKSTGKATDVENQIFNIAQQHAKLDRTVGIKGAEVAIKNLNSGNWKLEEAVDACRTAYAPLLKK